jgi:hypothetical protein
MTPLTLFEIVVFCLMFFVCGAMFGAAAAQ